MARASPYSRWDPVCWRIGKVTVSNYDRMFMATRIFLCQNTIFWMGWNLQILGWFLFRSCCQPVALKTQQKKRLLITSTDWISSPVAIWLVAVCVKSVVMMRTADNRLQSSSRKVFGAYSYLISAFPEVNLLILGCPFDSMGIPGLNEACLCHPQRKTKPPEQLQLLLVAAACFHPCFLTLTCWWVPNCLSVCKVCGSRVMGQLLICVSPCSDDHIHWISESKDCAYTNICLQNKANT